MKPWIVGITGASGAVYGIRLCEELLKRGREVHLVVTDSGWRVFHEELGWLALKRANDLRDYFRDDGRSLVVHPNKNIGASIASGSFRTEGMVVVPCSMGTLAGIAGGIADNLLKRAADVVLKERRKLILVPRETPLHEIHLRNMLTLSRMGAVILPAMPGFYQKPVSMDEMVDFMVGKMLDMMDIEHDLYRRWGDDLGEAASHRGN